MTVKRVLCSLLAVVVMAVMPLTAMAATVSHPISDPKAFKDVLGWWPVASNYTNPLPASLDYDFVVVLYSYVAQSDYYTYNFYFCKNGVVTNRSDNGYTSSGQSIWQFSANTLNAHAIYGHAWSYYPYSIGITNSFYRTMELPYSANMYRVEKADFPFNRVDAPIQPPPPPDPPSPPPPTVPPMTIPPFNAEMVPWDENKMDDFFIYVSNATGHIVNVGLVYFGLILAVYVVIRILKNFESVSSGGGQ